VPVILWYSARWLAKVFRKVEQPEPGTPRTTIGQASWLPYEDTRERVNGLTEHLARTNDTLETLEKIVERRVPHVLDFLDIVEGVKERPKSFLVGSPGT
jgi:hypothetical protein